MTQTSRPVAQHTDNYPDGDSGPYSSVQWRDVFKTLFTSDDDQGPIGGYLNNLRPDSIVGTYIWVYSGAAVVGGNILFNDSAVTFNPPNPAGAARYDYVVACLNDTDTPMTTSDAGYTLAFPTDLTDYDGSASIQEYACRLVIVRGTEGGGLPTLDQNDDHYMIPLASYLISTGGAISSFTDLREFIRQRSFFVPAQRGYNWDLVADIELDVHGTGASLSPSDDLRVAVDLPNTSESMAIGQFVVPDDNATGGDVWLEVQPVVYATASGNARIKTGVHSGPCDSASADTDVITSTEAITQDTFNCLTVRETAAVAGERAVVYTARDGDHADDTLGTELQVVGWIASYVGKA